MRKKIREMKCPRISRKRLLVLDYFRWGCYF